MAAGKKPDNAGPSVTEQEALDFHSRGGPASSRSSRPSRWRRSATCRSPIRRASRCRCARSPRIPTPAFDYTTRGNLVAVISNGTAILGLGNLGALASKPVMEGKAVLFKRFADVDSIDLEVDTEDVDEFINCGALSSARPSAASISRTSRRPTASSSRAAARADGHPGLPRRPARHRDHRHRRPDQRAAAHRPRHQDDEARLQRRRRRGIACVELVKAMRHAARERHPLRHQGRGLQGPHRGHEPVEVGACGRDRGAHAGRGDGRRRRGLRPVGQGRADAGDDRAPWRRTRSSSPWPIPIRRSRRRRWPRSATTRSWRPAAPTIPTRSTTSSAFPTSSAARSTCAPRTINDAMKIAAARGACGARPRGRARRGGRRLSGQPPALRARATSSRCRSIRA